MTCSVCFDLPGVWVETDDGLVIQPCPWCGPKVSYAAAHHPPWYTVQIARQIAAENPEATHDQIAEILHDRLRRQRVIGG